MKTSARVFSAVPGDCLWFWQQIHSAPTNGFFFGPPDSNISDQYMSAAEPLRQWQVPLAGVPDLLNKIKQSFRTSSPAPRYVGFLGFEAGRSFDKGIGQLLMRPNPLKTPVALFGDYAAIVRVDRKKRKTILYFRGTPRKREKLERKINQMLALSCSVPVRETKRERTGAFFEHPDQHAFSTMVRRAKDHIARGDIYQANLSIRFQKKFDGRPLNFYRALAERNPSPYSSVIKFGEKWIVGSSPELLIKVEGQHAITRPIAGTRPRGATRAADRRRRGQLLLSPKERAEHIMLVDLERNDLGRVCAPGSVKVTDRFSVENYSHVMHIVSQVEGRLAPAKDSVDALKAVFPGGTITGCPKIKSIEIIERIERIARGPFYGSAGFFCENGDAVFNILIRTALVSDHKIYIQAGAGIVADSNAKREYREVIAKAKALLEVAQ